MNNYEKMRGTLEVVRDALITMSAHEDDIEFVRAWIDMTQKEVDSALALPRRQCDVGTAEEQNRRMEDFCNNHHCGNCPIYNSESCALSWAQMPYHEGESKCI